MKKKCGQKEDRGLELKLKNKETVKGVREEQGFTEELR